MEEGNIMRKFYQELEIEILWVLQEDIITTSPNQNQFDDLKDDPFNPGDQYFG